MDAPTAAPLTHVLDARPPAADTLRAWWDATARIRGAWPLTIDRALIGGAYADRIGFAFAGGYAAALHALVPGLDGIAALCATEEGGNHPRAIKTRLEKSGVGYTLTGNKKWATVASEASSLLVVASVGQGEGNTDGKNRLRVARVPAMAKGVTIRSTATPFIPEIPHAEVDFDHVLVTERDVLPGDGYDDYLKPFRTVEDLHVHGALVGYLVGVCRRHGWREPVETLLALAVATRALADAERAPATHLALAGLIELATRAVTEVETLWAAAPDDEWARWQRDRALLQVAGSARGARRERAWSMVAP